MNDKKKKDKLKLNVNHTCFIIFILKVWWVLFFGILVNNVEYVKILYSSKQIKFRHQKLSKINAQSLIFIWQIWLKYVRYCKFYKLK